MKAEWWCSTVVKNWGNVKLETDLSGILVNLDALARSFVTLEQLRNLVTTQCTVALLTRASSLSSTPAQTPLASVSRSGNKQESRFWHIATRRRFALSVSTKIYATFFTSPIHAFDASQRISSPFLANFEFLTGGLKSTLRQKEWCTRIFLNVML